MGSSDKTEIRIALKIFNSVMALVGMPMILYGLRMLLVWQRENADASETTYDFTDLWFIYSVISVGLTFCLITCLGHVSANSSSNFCLNCYSALTAMLIFTESIVVADIILDSDWEHFLPKDPTGWFHDFEHYIDSNIGVFQWIGLFIVLAQAISVALALSLKGYSSGFLYGNSDDYLPTSFQLIYHNLDSIYKVGDPGFKSKLYTWKAEK